MSDLKDRATEAQEKLTKELESFESITNRLANQEVHISECDVTERVEIDAISTSNDYYDVEVEMPQIKHVIEAFEEQKKLLNEALAEIDRLNQTPSTESPGESGSVYFKEYYDELLQACAENDEARIAEHLHDGPELLRSAEIPCRIPQPQVTIADTETIKGLQLEVEYTKALLQVIGDKFGIRATSHCSMVAYAKTLEKESSIEDMIS